MNEYNSPEIEIIRFEVEEIIRTSPGEVDAANNIVTDPDEV